MSPASERAARRTRSRSRSSRPAANAAAASDVATAPADLRRLEEAGWEVLDPLAVSRDPEAYREFIRGSKGEFTVAKDVNVRLASGWFSDRGACYLAAGRPVLTQDTGFDRVLPTGTGLFSVRTLDDAVAAVGAIDADYPRHATGARAIACEHFAPARVLAPLVGERLGTGPVVVIVGEAVTLARDLIFVQVAVGPAHRPLQDEVQLRQRDGLGHQDAPPHERLHVAQLDAQLHLHRRECRYAARDSAGTCSWAVTRHGRSSSRRLIGCIAMRSST
jgi:hypothetical protein